MELIEDESASELLQAQTHVWNHAFNFINSMSLKCAVQLGIVDVLNKHGKPMTLSQLVSALPIIHPSKAKYVLRLMRILVHSGFFRLQKTCDDNVSQNGYSLTNSSRLLLKDNPLSLRPLLLLLLDPVLTKPWDCLSTWLQKDDFNAFSVAHGKTFWEYAEEDPRLNTIFNEAMASDGMLPSRLVLSKCKGVFDGVNSLVDVAGGSGTMAKAIAEAFPHMDCTVFDLPHVVSNLQGSENLKFSGGDMFEAIPPADAMLLKWTLHDWNDEDCVKILKKCKEAILSKGAEGKVIIIDIVRGNQNWDDKSVETQLFWDLQMMVCVNGMERDETEWANLFSDAGFATYKIHPVLGLRSLIELYP